MGSNCKPIYHVPTFMPVVRVVTVHSPCVWASSRIMTKKTDFGDGTFGSATEEGHSVKRERPVQWPVSLDGACLNYELEWDEEIQLYSAVDMLCTLGRYQVARQH